MSSGMVNDIEKFIQNNPQIANYTDIDGITPLHCAAYTNNNDLVNILLDNGADVNTKSKSDETPLMLAIKNTTLDVAVTLIKRGATSDQISTKHLSNSNVELIRDAENFRNNRPKRSMSFTDLVSSRDDRAATHSR